MAKVNDFRDMSLDELADTHGDLLKTKFETVNAAKLEKKYAKPHLLKQTKKDIARLLTVKREKQISNTQR
jgi:large subunit ribosomal protein L29